MGVYSQANRPLRVATPLGPDVLLLQKFTTQQGLSELFHIHLELLAENPVSFDRLLGQGVTVTYEIPGCPIVHLNGIVSEFGQGSRVAAANGKTTFIRYRAVVVPQLWLLTKRVQSRIFQHLSVPDILKSVLKDEWQLDVVFQFRDPFQKRDRCVQYRESDFAFVSRLMEEEGIYYSFVHEDGRHRLAITNERSFHKAIPNPSTLDYEESRGGALAPSRILTWEKTQKLAACKYTVWDQCFEMPGLHLEADQSSQQTLQFGEVGHRLNHQRVVSGVDMLEIYDYPGAYAHRFDGVNKDGGDQPQELQKIFEDNRRTAKIRMEQETAAAVRIHGTSTCAHFVPGQHFTLSHHFDGNGVYLLTKLEQSASLEGAYITGNGESLDYRNRFECLPGELNYRPPRRTPRPRVDGTQTATVVGPQGEEIHCDKYGRVKVQFPWDRREYNSSAPQGPHMLHDSSCWVRVSQTWAGKGFGAIHIPRIGQEVIVDFLEGDPDAPIIVGCVYNTANPPPFPLPQNATQSGFRTHTRGGSAANFSSLAFEDAPGQEHLHVHAEKYMTHNCENTMFTNVGQAHHEHVGKLNIRQVGGLPGFDHNMTVLNNSGSGSGGGPALRFSVQSDAGNGTTLLRPTRAAAATTVPPPTTTAAPTTRTATTPTTTTTAAPSPVQPFYTAPQLMGSWALDMNTVFGWQDYGTFGFYTNTVIGMNVTSAINPLELIEMFGAPLPVASSIPAAMFGATLANANTTAVLGGNTLLQYGPTININRGVAWNSTQALDNVVSTPCKLAALLYTGVVIGELFLPVLDSVGVPQYADALLGYTLENLALAAWIYAEKTYDALTQAAAAAAAPVPAPAFAANGDMPGAALTLKNATDLLARAGLIVGPAGAAAQAPPAITHTSAGDFSVLAPGIILQSSPTSVLNPGQTSKVTISANGVDDGPDGTVSVYGSLSAHLQGGEMASIDLQSVGVTGAITIDCEEAGTIKLQSGTLQEPNAVILEPDGITVKSALMITLQVEENSIVITPLSIVLKVGENTVTLGPSGLAVSCGGSLVQFNDTGITLASPNIAIAGDEAVNIVTAAMSVQ